MRIAICDDEVSMVQILEEKIKRWKTSSSILLRISIHMSI